jgi:hypothetical protein
VLGMRRPVGIEKMCSVPVGQEAAHQRQSGDRGKNLPSLACPHHGFRCCCSRRYSLDMSRRLTAIPSPFGTRCLHVVPAALGRFFGVSGRFGLAARSSISSCLISSRRSDVFLAAFCGLLGMLLLSRFAHACPPLLRVLVAISTRKSPSRTRTTVARSADGCEAAWDAFGRARGGRVCTDEGWLKAADGERRRACWGV